MSSTPKRMTRSSAKTNHDDDDDDLDHHNEDACTTNEPGDRNGGRTTTPTTTTSTTKHPINNNNNHHHHDGKSQNDWSHGTGILPGRDTIGPILLMMITPVFSIVYYHVCAVHDGNFYAFGETVMKSNLPLHQYLYSIWPSPSDPVTLQMIALFIGFQCVLVQVIPGPTFVATTTPHGHRPTYTANGLPCYILTILSLMLLDYAKIFRAALIYDKFGNILSSMNVIAFVFCVGLVVKGYTAPSGLDSGTTGSIIQDFYWGTELYPRIFSLDVKQMTNCRCGMMFWAVAIMAFGYKNMELNQNNIQYGMAISIILQLIYITKFFHWEMGYMCRYVTHID